MTRAEPAFQETLRKLVELVDLVVCFASRQPTHIQSALLVSALGNALQDITIAVTANV